MDILIPGSSPKLAQWVAEDYWPASHLGPDAACRRDRYERDVAMDMITLQ